jgi:hypothetical protein
MTEGIKVRRSSRTPKPSEKLRAALDTMRRSKPKIIRRRSAEWNTTIHKKRINLDQDVNTSLYQLCREWFHDNPDLFCFDHMEDEGESNDTTRSPPLAQLSPSQSNLSNRPPSPQRDCQEVFLTTPTKTSAEIPISTASEFAAALKNEKPIDELFNEHSQRWLSIRMKEPQKYETFLKQLRSNLEPLFVHLPTTSKSLQSDDAE